jgi:hypothetical protein
VSAKPAAVTPPAAPARTPAAAVVADHNAVVKRYCAGCHSDRSKAGDLSLASFDIATAVDHAETTEKMIRKLQAGFMPPPGAARPEPAVLQSLVSSLEAKMDLAAITNPNPGGRTFQRLNRPEYARAIRELVGIDVNAGNWLPLDTMSANFDNIADEQALSPTLLDAYLNAAADISRMAVGDKNAPSIDHTYTNNTYASQHPWDHIDGTPYGTRGGMVVEHVFPADGEYVFELTFTAGDNSRFEDVDLSIDGARVALIEYENGPQVAADGSGATPLFTEPILVRAGQHKVAAAFVRRVDGPYEDLIRPHDWSFAGGGSGGGGITTLPHLRDVIIRGPSKTTGISLTPSRQKIFTCRPTSSSDERACARQIVTRLGGEAYRRPLTAAETDRLMPFYEQEAVKNGFEAGVRSALEAILASPHFIFRLEKAPTDARGGGTYRVADVDLASRLSFFIWGLPPDKELIAAAGRKELSTTPASRNMRDACWPTRAPRAVRAIRRTVAASAGHRQGPSGSQLLPELRREPRRVDADRDQVVLLEPGQGRPQSPGSVSRRLHLRRRSPGTALRFQRRHRQRIPSRHLSRQHAARDPRSGQHARADLVRQSHIGGLARQVGHGSPDGHAASAASARCPRIRGVRRSQGRAPAHDARADGNPPQEPDLQFVPPLHGSDRAVAR